jgi:translocator protein
MAWVLPVIVAALAAMFVAFLGGTITEIGPWYRALAKPDWTPPDAAFGVAWTLIYALVAIAAVIAWRAAPDRRAAETLIGLFALNGFLNVMWSLLFFRLQRPDWAMLELVALWLSILALIHVIRRYAPGAAWLLVPYLLWVTFAGVLNLAVVRLNPAFG